MEKKTTERQYYMFALRIFADFGASIAVPVVLFVLIGQYFDNKYDNYPLYTIIGLIISALVTVKIIFKKSKAYGKEYQVMVNRDIKAEEGKKNTINKLVNKE